MEKVKETDCRKDTVNNDSAKTWCLSCKLLKTKQQATVCLSDEKKYKYASRFPVQAGDLVIVGNKFAYGTFATSEINPLATTGMFGFVTEAIPKVEIKKDFAAELDFVFTSCCDKKVIKECVKYIELDDCFVTLQNGLEMTPVRPITMLARKMLAAASILANNGFADSSAIELAKSYILSKPTLPEGLSHLIYGMWMTTADLSQAFVPFDNKKDLPDIIDESYNKETAILGNPDKGYNDLLKNEEINAYITKYSYLAAISIMAQNGFAEMLKAFLEVNPPIEEYAEEIKAIVEFSDSEKVKLIFA